MTVSQDFDDLPALAASLRNELESKKFILLYAYNVSVNLTHLAEPPAIS